MPVFHIPEFFERSQGLGLFHGLGVLQTVGTEERAINRLFGPGVGNTRGFLPSQRNDL